MTQSDQISANEVFKLEQEVNGGANWFFIIGGLSIVNSLIVIFGGGVSFVVGLGATLFIDGISNAVVDQVEPAVGTAVQVVGFLITSAVAGIFVVLGLLARKKHQWAFIVGICLYALDGLFLLMLGEFLGVGFHLFALVGLIVGLNALRKLKAVDAGKLTIVADLELVNNAQTQKQPRGRRFWLKLALPTLILLIPLVIFLVFLFTYE